MIRVVLLNDKESIPYELKQFPAKLGRHPDCDVQIDSGMVSRYHSQIIQRGDSYFLEDLNSGNGTFLNAHQVAKGQVHATPLAHNDRIKLGPIKFRFENTSVPAEVSSSSGPALAEDGGVELVDGSSATIMGSAIASGFGALQTRPEEKLKGILRINQALAGTVDPAAIAPLILDTLFDIFPQADRGSILTKRSADDRFIPIAQKKRDENNDESVRLSRTIMMKVIDEKAGVLSADAANDDRFSASESISNLTIRSMMCVPMLDLQQKPFGIINLDTQNPAKLFKDEDLELLLAVATQAATAWENMRLMENFLENKKREEEMRIAMQVQKSLLPETLPEVPGYKFFASYDAAQAVGGDYFDCFLIGEQKICFSFGDVAGKGVPGALIMSRVSSVVQNTMSFTDDVALAIRRINNHMCHNMVSGRFVTYTLGVIDLATHRLSLANAGHYAVAVRKPGGEMEEIGKDQIGIPVGIMEDYDYDVVEYDIAPGETFLLRTDGVDEAMAPNGDLYTTEKVRDFFTSAAGTPAEIGRALLADVRRHANGRAQNDDIAIMVFGRLP
ncbi:MAG: Phosphoserine phosphatase RsbU [Planctomycetota bacterium]